MPDIPDLPAPVRSAFSVDLEDWYHGIELPFSDWPQYEPRLRAGLDPLLELLERHGVRATFFTLGWIAEKYPEVVREVAAAGHELASHGYSHEKVYDLTREAFREEVRRTKGAIEELTGTEVTAFRAPFFSVTPRSLWALDALAAEGYRLDCSISPVKTWRYGIANCPDEIFRLGETGLIEAPVSTIRLGPRRWAVGGAYFRLLPYALTRRGMRSRIEAGRATMFYIHPWEYDPDHPRVPMERKARITHYTRLSKTLPYTDRLLRDFRFGTVSEMVRDHESRNDVRTVSLDLLQD